MKPVGFWQNREALDWISEKGGVCHMFGEQCCTYIPENTATSGSFTTAMSKLKELRQEVTEDEGGSRESWDWFASKFGQCGTVFAKIGTTVLIVLVIIILVVCCIIPILNKVFTKAFAQQMSTMATTKVAEAQLVQMVIKHADLFLIPDYYLGSDNESKV